MAATTMNTGHLLSAHSGSFGISSNLRLFFHLTARKRIHHCGCLRVVLAPTRFVPFDTTSDVASRDSRCTRYSKMYAVFKICRLADDKQFALSITSGDVRARACLASRLANSRLTKFRTRKSCAESLVVAQIESVSKRCLAIARDWIQIGCSPRRAS